MKKPAALLILLFSFFSIYAGNAAKTGDLQYIRNQGQWDAPVEFMANLYGGNVYLEKAGFTWSFSNLSDLGDIKHDGNISALNDFIIKTHAFKTTFVGASNTVELSGADKFDNYYNYFHGNDQKKWQGHVPAYGEVDYKSLYPGIDMIVYGRSNSLKYDMVIAAGADPDQIQINYSGLDNIRIANGNLELITSINTVMELQPVAYQMIGGVKKNIRCEFVLNGTTVGFLLPDGYDPNYPLTIDPATLIFASYSGSTSDNWGYSATYDNDGNLYGAGIAFALGYPTTLGAYQVAWSFGPGIYVADVTLSKFASDGTSLIYSTYFGGSSEDLPYSLIVDNANEVVVYGSTGSADLPVTASAYDNSFNGGTNITVDYVLTFLNGSDAFVAKFNADCTALVGSTFIGGTSNDALNTGTTAYNYGDHARGEVNLDASGNILIASCTQSSNLPTTAGAFQTSLGGGQDGFVAKFNPDLSTLNWCSYLGGSTDDGAFSIKQMHGSKMVICGGTASNNFPTTAGALHTAYNGGSTDGYVTIINGNATNILNSTYIGTSAYDQTFLTEIDDANSVYITGQTLGDYPVLGTVYSNAGGTQFITKLDSTLSSIYLSTIFGSGDPEINISPTAFLVDNCDHIYVAGWGGNVNKGFNPATGDVYGMPITPDAFQSSTDGSDFYLVVFDVNATALLYATYFGGGTSDEHVDGGTSRFDKQGIVYEAVCAGCGGSDDFPTTEGVVSNTNNAPNCNLGVFKFSFVVPPTTAAFIADPIEGCSPIDVDFTNLSVNASSYLWDFGDGGTTVAENPTHTYSDPGTYEVQLIANIPTECGYNDTTSSTITVYGHPTADFTYSPTDVAVYAPAFFTDMSTDAVEWFWDFGDGFTSTDQNPTHLFADVGGFEVCLTVTNEHGCTDKICDSVYIAELSELDVPNAFSPNGDGVNDIFLPLNYGLEDFEFRVYNRWGQLLFVSNDPDIGWDGYYNKIPQELDVYVYIVTGHGVDNVPYYKQGNFTLVR